MLPFRSGFVATSDRPNPLSIGEPPESLGLGDTSTARCVLGPVDLPPWKRQRVLPGSALTRQQPPARVLAPQRSRPSRRFDDGWLDTNVMSRTYQ
jgi:hypothetical protein